MTWFKQLTTLLCALLVSASMFAQNSAKKPRLVVIPSNNLMQKLGCLQETDDMGASAPIPDYSKALLDDDLRAAISKIGEIFQTTYNFPLTDLNQQLNKIKGKGAGVIPVDVRLELNYKITSSGPRKILYFELMGFDQYSSKQIAAASGESAPAIGGTVTNLLQEAVLAKADKFVADIQTFFDNASMNGRESVLTIKSECGADLSKGILKWTEEWLAQNCVKGSFSTDNVETDNIEISQSMMPLIDGKGNAIDAAKFYTPLQKFLDSKVATKNYQAVLDRSASANGGGILGSAIIVIKDRSESADDDF